MLPFQGAKKGRSKILEFLTSTTLKMMWKLTQQCWKTQVALQVSKCQVPCKQQDQRREKGLSQDWPGELHGKRQIKLGQRRKERTFQVGVYE